MGVAVAQFEVYVVSLDPTVGSEMRKTRPCVVVSPDEMNEFLRTVIVAPLTTGGREYPTRPPCGFAGRSGHVALDQIRAIDKSRLGRPVGRLNEVERSAILRSLQEMFAEDR